MDLKEKYNNFKKVLSGDLVIDEIVERSIYDIYSFLYDWIMEGWESNNFKKLMEAIGDDYSYNGTVYRGITLLKENEANFNDFIYFNKSSSFSIKKEIAIEFANNGKISIDDEINIDKSNEELIPIILGNLRTEPSLIH